MGDAFQSMPATITTHIIGLLSPQSAANLSQTDKHFHSLTANKLWADYSEHIVKQIADYNDSWEYPSRGTPVRLVRAWLTLGKTEWVGALDRDGAATIAQAIRTDEKKHPKLTSITINILQHEQNLYDFNNVLEFLLHNKGENIKTINIGTDDWIGQCPDDLNIHVVADCCPNLISITVESSMLTNVSIEYLALKCKLLEHVDLEGTSDTHPEDMMGVFSGIYDAGIIALAKNCQNLKYLDVGLSCLSDKSLVALGENCPHLSWIRLYNYNEANDMEYLISDQKHYGPVGLKALTEGCKHIEISYRGHR